MFIDSFSVDGDSLCHCKTVVVTACCPAEPGRQLLRQTRALKMDREDGKIRVLLSLAGSYQGRRRSVDPSVRLRRAWPDVYSESGYYLEI